MDASYAMHTETRLDLFAGAGWCVRGRLPMAGLGRFLLLRLPGCPAGLLSDRDLPASGCGHNPLGFGCSPICPARFLRETDRSTAGGGQGSSWSGRSDRDCACPVVSIRSSQRTDGCV
jgi:hypothetical protein